MTKHTSLFPEHMKEQYTQECHRNELNMLMEMLARKRACRLKDIHTEICHACNIASLERLSFSNLAQVQAYIQQEVGKLNSEKLKQIYDIEVQTNLLMQHIHNMKQQYYEDLFMVAVKVLHRDPLEISQLCWDITETVFSQEIPNLIDNSFFVNLKKTVLEQPFVEQHALFSDSIAGKTLILRAEDELRR